jgi:hypothetical protein
MEIPSWTNYIQPRSTPAVGDFKLTPEEDAREDGPHCTSFNLCQGNGRMIRITTKVFPQDDSSERVGAPPTYIYIKLFKWDKGQRKLLKYSQTFMNLYEYNDFHQAKETIDNMLSKLLLGVGVPHPQQPQQQQQQHTDMPPPYSVKEEYNPENPRRAFFEDPIEDCQ